MRVNPHAPSANDRDRCSAANRRGRAPRRGAEAQPKGKRNVRDHPDHRDHDREPCRARTHRRSRRRARDGAKSASPAIRANPLTVRELLDAGVHFGHQTKRWNPKMRPYIYGARNGIHIIDLDQTARLFKRAFDFVTETVARGGHVLFVGTKRQAAGDRRGRGAAAPVSTTSPTAGSAARSRTSAPSSRASTACARSSA